MMDQLLEGNSYRKHGDYDYLKVEKRVQIELLLKNFKYMQRKGHILRVRSLFNVTSLRI